MSQAQNERAGPSQRMRAIDGFGAFENEERNITEDSDRLRPDLVTHASSMRDPSRQSRYEVSHRNESFKTPAMYYNKKAYVHPARLKMMPSPFENSQQESWHALNKSINSLVNKLTTSNIKYVCAEILRLNLLRGRGLLCKALMKIQSLSPAFTPLFAALISVVNSKVPEAGDLLCQRLVSQFKQSYKANDKQKCHASAYFLSHLANQLVLQYTVIDQLTHTLLDRPHPDAVELAIILTRETGSLMQTIDMLKVNKLFDRFRSILHTAQVDRRIQYQIEVLFQIRKEGWKGRGLKEEFDLVEEAEQYTHDVDVDGEQDLETNLDTYAFDKSFDEHEKEWQERVAEIFGSDEEEEVAEEDVSDVESEGLEVIDHAQTDRVALRRLIYLTIMKSVTYEEAVHNLSRINLGQPGNEPELTNMIIECCSQERTYSKFYGLIAQRFCQLRKLWQNTYEQAFATYYDTIHRYESNRLRNIATLFGHLLANDAVSWSLFLLVRMNEDDTTSSSRTFIKHLFTEMRAQLGDTTLAKLFIDPERQQYFTHLFPHDESKKTRFSINYFTAIGLGRLTEEMREHLINMPKMLAAPESDSDSSTESSTLTSSSEDERREIRDGRQGNTRRISPRPALKASRSPRRSRSPDYGGVRRSRSPTPNYTRPSHHMLDRRRSRSPQRDTYRPNGREGMGNTYRGSRSPMRQPYGRRSRSRSPRRRISPSQRSPSPRWRRRSDSRSRSRSPVRRGRSRSPTPRRDRGPSSTPRRGFRSSQSRSRSRSKSQVQSPRNDTNEANPTNIKQSVAANLQASASEEQEAIETSIPAPVEAKLIAPERSTTSQPNRPIRKREASSPTPDSEQASPSRSLPPASPPRRSARLRKKPN